MEDYMEALQNHFHIVQTQFCKLVKTPIPKFHFLKNGLVALGILYFDNYESYKESGYL
jgi:hypothetical protein